MGRRYRFRNAVEDLDLALIVEASPQMKRFREHLENELPGSPVDRKRAAQGHCENLVAALFDDFNNDYIKNVVGHLNEIQKIRKELANAYDSLLTLDPSAKGLPGELSPANLTSKFDELERHLQAIEQHTPGRHVKEMGNEIPTANIQQVSDAIQQDLGSSRAKRGSQTARQVQPDLPLDEPTSWERRPSITEKDRIARQAWQERKQFLPEDPHLRQQLEAHANDFAQRNLPKNAGWQVSIQRIGADGRSYSHALQAQMSHLSGLDPTFSGRGYELIIIRPDGKRFRPDGIRFHDADNQHYTFLSHKEPYGEFSTSFFSSPEGKRKLLKEMEEYAGYALELQGNGCRGVMYSSPDPKLLKVFEALIANIRDRNPELGRMLSVISPN